MSNATEYMVHIWGGAWNPDACPSIEKETGIKEGYYYFSTKEAKDAFVKFLQTPVYKCQGMMIRTEKGNLTHKRTVFIGMFKYADKVFTLDYDFGYEYPSDSAIFMFTQGNYSCDCNLSMFIRNKYGEDAIPELDCGCEIELLDYHIEYWD